MSRHVVLVIAVLLCALAAAAWWYGGAAMPRALRSAVLGAATPQPPLARSTPPAPAALRKCRTAPGAVEYTDGDCPPGSTVEPVSGGTVSVLPAAPGAPAASAPAALRRLADQDGSAALTEHRIEQAGRR